MEGFDELFGDGYLWSRFLERARAEAAELGVAVEYVEGDMRAIPWRERFDLVLNWFTAFGYFPDEELHAVLRNVRAALRPGGRFLLEMVSLTKRHDALPLRGDHRARRRLPARAAPRNSVYVGLRMNTG